MTKYISLLRLSIKIIVVLMFSGCAALGTETISTSNDLNHFKINKIGFSQLAGEEIINKIKPNTSEIYQTTCEDFFIKKQIEAKRYNLSKFESIDSINEIEIKNLCEDNGLDGFICTQIKYKFIDSNYMLIELGTSEDVYAELKLYDKMGILLLHIKHNTSEGNTYMMHPIAEQTVKDGTLGVLNRMMKEIKIFQRKL